MVLLQVCLFFLGTALLAVRAAAARALGGGCLVGGCSGQLCRQTSVISTCEWVPEYACYRFANCERQKNGSCGDVRDMSAMDGQMLRALRAYVHYWA